MGAGFWYNLRMDSKNGGLSSDEKQRQAAADLARRNVLKAYEQQQMDWKKYHTAWQDYYQKYYSQYYMNAAKEYVAKTQVKQLRDAEAQRTVEGKYSVPVAVAENLTGGEKEREVRSFKARIQARAAEKAKSSRRQRLMPIVMGLAVVATILFLQYNRLIFAPIAAYVSPGESPVSEITAVDPTVTLTKVSSDSKLIIPKLNVDVPLNFGVGLDGVMEATKHDEDDICV